LVIRRWDPLRDLLTLQERMNRLFDESLVSTRAPEPLLDSDRFTPLADVYETADAFVFQLDLPGVREEDVEIHAEVDQLTIRGERRLAEAVRPDCFHRMERSYGHFSRSFALPAEVDPSRATAQFQNGLLRLEIRKLPAQSTRGGAS
jgi:HSP20 family protein